MSGCCNDSPTDAKLRASEGCPDRFRSQHNCLGAAETSGPLVFAMVVKLVSLEPWGPQSCLRASPGGREESSH